MVQYKAAGGRAQERGSFRAEGRARPASDLQPPDMRTVSYELFARSALPGETVHGSVTQLLRDLPYLLALRVIPPLDVVNDVLSTGVDDAGMSGGARWTPFAIDQEEWEEIRAGLEADEPPCTFVQPPDWVHGYEDWHVWLFAHLFGVPAEEHRRLNREEERLARAIERARAEGDENAVLDYHVQRVQVSNELAALLGRYLRPRS